MIIKVMMMMMMMINMMIGMEMIVMMTWTSR